jgi:transcriptional repressor NrdR
LVVIKKAGRRESFDREKLERAIHHALRKRPVEPDRVERMITGIVRRLESFGENEIPSHIVGELVMQALSSLDKVAYIRFASVYKNFREAKDFETFVGELSTGADQD